MSQAFARHAAAARPTRQPIGSRRLAGAALALAVAYGACTAALVWGGHDRPVLRLGVAFDSAACCTWQVWPGGVAKGEPNLLTVRPGTHQVYTVPVGRSHLDRLSISFAARPGGEAHVYRIWLTRGARTVGEVTPAQLHHATFSNAFGRPAGSGVVVQSTGPQPALDLPVSLDAHEPQIRVELANARSHRLLWYAGLLLVGSLCVLLLGLDWRRHWAIAVAVAIVILGTRGIPSLTWRLHFRDDVSAAVGNASYTGRWKSRERAVVDLSYVLGVVAALAVPLVVRRRGGARPDESQPHAHETLRLPWRITLAAVPPLIVALAAVPNLHRWVAARPKYTPSWDGNNLLFAQYLIRTTHLAPVKDFYWLYGFQWLADKSPPWGVLFSYGWSLLFWVLLSLGTYLSLDRFFSGRSFAIRYVVLTSFWLTAVLTSDMAFATRYVAAIGTVLIFTSIDGDRDPWWSWKRVLFALSFFAVLLFEPAQAIYALVPIAFFAATEILLERRSRHGTPIHTLATAGSIAVPFAAAVVVYWATGALRPTLTIYRAFLFATPAYAYPGLVDGWVVHPTNLASVIFWAVPLTIVLGLTGLVLGRGSNRLTYAVVTALGLLGVMIMQKQALRPDISGQIWLPVVFGLAYWAVSDTLLSRARYSLALPALAGTMLAIVVASGGYHSSVRAVPGGPERAVDSVQSLLHERKVFAAQARTQFAPPTFDRFTQYKPVVRALQAIADVKNGGQVWILGDDSPIIMMLGQSWPYYLNDMYDSSPIFFQKRVIAELTSHPPARVVWNFAGSAMTFDLVPMEVRDPLLYTWAVRHLVPEQRVNQFEILRPRQSAEPVALAWWRRRIGVLTNFGRIPAAATMTGPCHRGRCSPFLRVRFAPGAPRPPQVVIPVEVNGLDFQVAFDTGRESTYVLPLDRVWFWAGTSTGSKRVGPGNLSGATVDVVERADDAHILY